MKIIFTDFKEQAKALCRNAQCEYMCLPAAKVTKNATVTCVCADNQQLKADGRSCTAAPATPKPTTKQPVTTQKPGETTQKPEVTTKKPSGTSQTQKPVQTTKGKFMQAQFLIKLFWFSNLDIMYFLICSNMDIDNLIRDNQSLLLNILYVLTLP